jgi:hypothetical protein
MKRPVPCGFLVGLVVDGVILCMWEEYVRFTGKYLRKYRVFGRSLATLVSWDKIRVHNRESGVWKVLSVCYDVSSLLERTSNVASTQTRFVLAQTDLWLDYISISLLVYHKPLVGVLGGGNLYINSWTEVYL